MVDANEVGYMSDVIYDSRYCGFFCVYEFVVEGDAEDALFAGEGLDLVVG